jgi:hypothetical protein
MKGDFTRDTFDRRKHYSRVLMQQGRVQLDADWNEAGAIQAYLRQTTARDVIGLCGVPQPGGGFEIEVLANNQVVAEGEPGDELRLSAGRIYVAGLLCENEEAVLLTLQPDLPDCPLPSHATQAGRYLAYLDVWQRHITALEDSGIREEALGGPDTASRLQTVCQVKFEKVEREIEDCSGFGPDWQPEEAVSSGWLRARTLPGASSEDPCIIPPQAKYRRAENQLYRVEIHKAGPAGSATFKWSRDNGSMVTRLERIEGNRLVVSNPGRDDLARFAAGQWLELSDERRVLYGEPGVLVKLAAVDGNELTVVTWPDDGSPQLGEKPTVRRWDSPGAVPIPAIDGATSTEEGNEPVAFSAYLDLEDGVQVAFSDGQYCHGDYWLIPARTALGDVLWPVDEASGEPVPEPRHGIDHHYCALALLGFDGSQWQRLQDCRQLFPPLTELKQTWPTVVGISWNNDRPMSKEDFNNGLTVTFSEAMNSATAGLDTFIVTVETAAGTAAPMAQSFIVPGTVAGEGDNNQTWRYSPVLDQIPLPEVGQIRCRVVLKGNTILDEQGERPLDGDAFGKLSSDPDTNEAFIDLIFPSGDGHRGGNFESWFYLALGQG